MEKKDLTGSVSSSILEVVGKLGADGLSSFSYSSKGIVNTVCAKPCITNKKQRKINKHFTINIYLREIIFMNFFFSFLFFVLELR